MRKAVNERRFLREEEEMKWKEETREFEARFGKEWKRRDGLIKKCLKIDLLSRVQTKPSLPLLLLNELIDRK
jgi:hypothetical protein